MMFGGATFATISFLGGGLLLPALCIGQQAIQDTNYSTLAAACDAAGSGTLVLTRTWTAVPDGTNLPCRIHAIKGGMIQPAAGGKVTLSGSFDADITQHFDSSQKGFIIPGNGFSTGAIYPQWFGAKADGRTITDGIMRAGSDSLTSPTTHFLSADVGKYISVSGAGLNGSGLGSTISSVTKDGAAVLSTPASASAGGAIVTYGTNDYASVRATASAVNWNGVRHVEFPPGIYVIGQHKTFAGSSVVYSQDIEWRDLRNVTISGYGATIYIDGSFFQDADTSGERSNENTVTPFRIVHATDVTVQGFAILGNKDLIVRAKGVKSESLTSFCVTVGGDAVSSNYMLRDISCTQPQTDCYYFGMTSAVTDLNANGSNLTCVEPARGNFSVSNVKGLHLSGVHGSNAGAGSYGGYQPFHCIDIEPNLPTADNILLDGGSTCTNDIGWEFTVITPAKVNHVTIRDSTFSWNNPTKQQGFNCNAASCEVSNALFNIGYPASANNILAPGGPPGPSFSLSSWHDNRFVDQTGAHSGTLLSSGFAENGTLNPVDFTGNTFILNGLDLNLRNLRQFAGNHVYWRATGFEHPGTTTIVDFEGSQSIHDNDYNTNLSNSEKTLQIDYRGRAGTPAIANERYLSGQIRANLPIGQR